MERYDAIVIGSGQAGTPLSIALAQSGRKTILLESRHVGGTCINEGCTPTKTMVASARVAYLARRGNDYGVRGCNVAVDLAKVRERKRAIVNSFRTGGEARIQKTPGLELLMAAARFTGPKTVEAELGGGVRQFTAEHIFINTGTRAKRPPIEGLSGVPALDNASIMELNAVPEHLIILGGGYIGVEFGQMFRRFGSRVTIIHQHSRLLGLEDRDVAEEVDKILREDGIELLLDSNTRRVSGDSRAITVEIDGAAGVRTLSGSHLLLATGRKPNSDELNLTAAGIETDARGYIKTNDRLETTAAGVYALGDVKGGPAFTHISYDDYRIIRANLIEGKNASIRGRLVPYTVFIDPQLGRVGLTEEEAISRGLEIEVAKMPMTQVARAIETDETRGFMKAVIDASSKQILGAAVLSVEGGEVMAMIEVAIMGRLPYSALRDGIFAHPTLAESLNNLFLSPIRSRPSRSGSDQAASAA